MKNWIKVSGLVLVLMLVVMVFLTLNAYERYMQQEHDYSMALLRGPAEAEIFIINIETGKPYVGRESIKIPVSPLSLPEEPSLAGNIVGLVLVLVLLVVIYNMGVVQLKQDNSR